MHTNDAPDRPGRVAVRLTGAAALMPTPAKADGKDEQLAAAVQLVEENPPHHWTRNGASVRHTRVECESPDRTAVGHTGQGAVGPDPGGDEDRRLTGLRHAESSPIGYPRFARSPVVLAATAGQGSAGLSGLPVLRSLASPSVASISAALLRPPCGDVGARRSTPGDESQYLENPCGIFGFTIHRVFPHP